MMTRSSTATRSSDLAEVYPITAEVTAMLDLSAGMFHRGQPRQHRQNLFLEPAAGLAIFWSRSCDGSSLL